MTHTYYTVTHVTDGKITQQLNEQGWSLGMLMVVFYSWQSVTGVPHSSFIYTALNQTCYEGLMGLIQDWN